MQIVVVMRQDARLPVVGLVRVTSKHSVSSTSVSPTMTTSNVFWFTLLPNVTSLGTV